MRSVIRPSAKAVVCSFAWSSVSRRYPLAVACTSAPKLHVNSNRSKLCLKGTEGKSTSRRPSRQPSNFIMDYSGVGSIKKIFGRQREPYGFVSIHQPPEVKGMEAVFYLKDVLVPEDERRLLQGGLIVRFNFARKPMDRMKAPCPFKATQVRVQDPMEYKGTVARCGQGSLTVFLDVLFKQARVPVLSQSAGPGDRCIVTISWKQMVRALRKNRDPVGQLIALDPKTLSGKDNYLKNRDLHTAATSALSPASGNRSKARTSLPRYDDLDDEVFTSSFAQNRSLSASRDSRDSDSAITSTYSTYHAMSSMSSHGQDSAGLRLAYGHYQPTWSGVQSSKTNPLSGCGFGLLGGSIWSMDSGLKESDLRESRGSSSSGGSTPDSTRRDSLGDNDKWTDDDWHMQTIRIAEMALPGKR